MDYPNVFIISYAGENSFLAGYFSAKYTLKEFLQIWKSDGTSTMGRMTRKETDKFIKWLDTLDEVVKIRDISNQVFGVDLYIESQRIMNGEY